MVQRRTWWFLALLLIDYTGTHRRKVTIQILISSKSIPSYSLHEKMEPGPGHHSLLSVEHLKATLSFGMY